MAISPMKAGLKCQKTEAERGLNRLNISFKKDLNKTRLDSRYQVRHGRKGKDREGLK